MFKKIFRKTFLLSGILLLSVFVIVQYSWSCDDKDKWDCDDHDKWSCNKHGEPCHPPKIEIVFLDYDDDSIVFEIWGKNFGRGAPPAVTLGGIYDLTVDEALTEDYVITATLSSIAEKNFVFGDYRLVVSTCHDYSCKDKYCKDHGPKCKCKYCKDHCSKCKDKYCKDHEYKCKCKDRYSLTIPGPPGQPGPPGTIESVMVKRDGNQIPGRFNFEGYAPCEEGYVVTGGGFESVNLKIIKSRPDGNSWYILGRVVNEIESEPPSLSIYAICAKIK